MFEFVWYVLEVVVNTALELLIYMFVDVFTKNTLRDTSEVSEKRSIWLCEVAVLTVLGVVCFIFHHCPYVLLTLTLLTLAYTQLLERVNFRYWWVSLGTKWEEFQQHEESMGRWKMNSQQSTPGGAWGNSSNTPNGGRYHPPPPPPTQHTPMVPQYVQYDSSMAAPAEAWYPGEGRRPVVMLSESPVSYSLTVSPSARPRPVPMATQPQPGYTRVPPEYMVQQAAPPPGYGYMIPRVRELARPPLHPNNTPPGSKPVPSSQTSTTPSSSSIKSRVMSALGMKTQQSAYPPGLRNNGENICFVNSVVQCLAHCPGLPRRITENETSPDCTPAQAALVTAVSDLLESLGKAPTNTPLLNVDKMRQTASGLPGTMVAGQRDVQNQQDAAEFLMWLLDVLHSALDLSSKRRDDERQQQAPNAPNMSWITPRYSSQALNMLRFIYGDLTPEKIKELKAACRREIELAGGVDVTGYAEPLQRLSDLEWLTYKETAQSVIDDLFTGQIVEALHCRACDRLTVDIQTFNILPVPITQPRSLTGLVRLEDCLAAFGTVEELFGQEGLQCEGCNKQRESSDHADPSVGASPIFPLNGVTRVRLGDTVRRRKLGSDSAIYSPSSVSPISAGRSQHMMNDSGFQDHAIRTSTPIGGRGTTRLTDGQRRSMLRQVPECLVIQLMRFTYAGGQPGKLHQPVILPLTGLDLTPQIVDTVIQRTDITSQTASHRYDLTGLCLHLGSEMTVSGHYVSYGKTADGEWFRYDDDQVAPVNMDYELSTRQVRENAYLAFYRRAS